MVVFGLWHQSIKIAILINKSFCLIFALMIYDEKLNTRSCFLKIALNTDIWHFLCSIFRSNKRRLACQDMFICLCSIVLLKVILENKIKRLCIFVVHFVPCFKFFRLNVDLCLHQCFYFPSHVFGIMRFYSTLYTMLYCFACDISNFSLQQDNLVSVYVCL